MESREASLLGPLEGARPSPSHPSRPASASESALKGLEIYWPPRSSATQWPFPHRGDQPSLRRRDGTPWRHSEWLITKIIRPKPSYFPSVSGTFHMFFTCFHMFSSKFWPAAGQAEPKPLPLSPATMLLGEATPCAPARDDLRPGR